MANPLLAEDGELYDSETGELINEVEQVEVEVIEDTLPAIVCNGGTHIVTNTEQLKKELAIHLEKYDIEVTQETEKDASKMATELNKLAKDLNSKRLSVGKEIKKPAELLKDSIDELIKIVQDKRTSILEGVEVFKAKRFEIIRGYLEQERDKLFADLQVGEDYQFLDIEVLVKETSFTKSSKLSKSALESLQSMVRGIKAIEDAVTIRTLQLKSTCQEAGLEYPIQIEEVSRFIKEDNYDEQLNEMIQARLTVEKQVKEKAEAEAEQKRKWLQEEEERKEKAAKENEERLKRESEQKQKDELARVEKEKNDEIARIQREADEKEEARLAEIKRIEDAEIEKKRLEQNEIDRKERERIEQEQKSQKKIVTLTATFEVEVDLDVHELKVLEKYEDKLSRDFKSLKSVLVK